MDFVSYEIAKKLKEKGFREACLGYYYGLCVIPNSIDTYDRPNQDIDYSDMLVSWNSAEEKCDIFDAPTIEQVMRWMREKKISIEIFIHQSRRWGVTTYKFDDEFVDCTPYKYDGIDDSIYTFYYSYEDAAFAAIKHVLDNLI